MDIPMIFLAIVVVAVGSYLYMKVPSGVWKVLAFIGKGLIIALCVALFLMVLTLTAFIFALSVSFFTIGSFFRYIGEKGTLIFLPALSKIWKFGLECLDAARTRYV